MASGCVAVGTTKGIEAYTAAQGHVAPAHTPGVTTLPYQAILADKSVSQRTCVGQAWSGAWYVRSISEAYGTRCLLKSL